METVCTLRLPSKFLPADFLHSFPFSDGAALKNPSRISWFLGGSVVKNPSAKVGDTGDAGSIPGLRRYPGDGYGNPLQYSCLAHTMDRGVWRATMRGVRVRCDRACTNAKEKCGEWLTKNTLVIITN